MRECLTVILYVVLIYQTICLFDKDPDSKFSIIGLSNPTQIAMNPTATKFIVWNNISQFQIYSTAGAQTCSGSIGSPIISIIWPRKYTPIALLYPGNKLLRIDEFYCHNMKFFLSQTTPNGFRMH
jgi:hypothetical protein